MRECGGCTECCQGHLTCEVRGFQLRKGQPCHFLGKGCTIYEERPESPCRTYLCVWRQNAELPEWFRPDMSGVLVTRRPYADGKDFWDVLETRPMHAKNLMWLMAYHLRMRKPMRIWIEGAAHMFGPDEFHDGLAQGKPLPALS